MGSSELVATLYTFSESERRNLDMYLRSPFCTDGKDATNECLLVELIFEALAKGREDNPKLGKTALYATIYPRHDFVKQTIDNLASRTLKYVRQFIVTTCGKDLKRPVYNYTQLLRYFREKGDYDLCEKYLKRLNREKPLDRSPDPLDYMQNWQSEETKSEYLGMKTAQNGDFNLLESLNALDEFYLVKRMEILTTIFNQNTLSPILSVDQAQNLIHEVEAWSAHPSFKLHLVQISQKTLLFLNTDGPEAAQHFEEFRLLLAEEEGNLSLYYLKRLESLAYNFCARRFRQKKYRRIIFDLFRRRIQPDRLNKEGTIQSIELLSMLKTGILGKEFKLVKTLLETFKDKIKGSQPSKMYYDFCRAFLYFNEGKFEESYALAYQLRFIDTTYKYVSKILRIKLWYETRETDYEFLDSKLMAFRVALTRERNIAPATILSYRNFVNFMVRLNHWCIQPEKDWQQLWDMYKEILNSTQTGERRWLAKKIKEKLNAAPPGSFEK